MSKGEGSPAAVTDLKNNQPNAKYKPYVDFF